MKKLYTIIVLSILSMGSTVHAWFYAFTNETASPVHVKITYGGIAGEQEPFQLAPKAGRKVNSLIECLKKIEVWPHNSSNITTHYPPSTGLYLDCSSENFVITQGADGQLVVKP